MLPVLILYYALLLAVDLISIWQWRYFSKAEKYLAVLIWLTTIDELVAFFVQLHYKNDMAVYHIYSPVELMLVACYFNESIAIFKKWRIGLWVGLTGILFGIVNAAFLQPLNTINANFLLFEGTCIIICCLFSLHQVLLNQEHLPYRFAQFWITCALLIYWSLTFSGWAVFLLVSKQEEWIHRLFYTLLAVSNYLFYVGIAIIFLKQRKLIPSGA